MSGRRPFVRIWGREISLAGCFQQLLSLLFTNMGRLNALQPKQSAVKSLHNKWPDKVFSWVQMCLVKHKYGCEVWGELPNFHPSSSTRCLLATWVSSASLMVRHFLSLHNYTKSSTQYYSLVASPCTCPTSARTTICLNGREIHFK